MGCNVDGARGDTVIIAPPHNASADDLEQIVQGLADWVQGALDEVGRS